LVAMPRSLADSARMTARKSAFARHYVENPKRNGTAAAIKAGYAKGGATSRAYELTHNDPGVMDLIAGHEKAMQERHGVTVDTITDELDAAAKNARENGHCPAEVNAIMGKAKLHGLIVDKAKVEVGDLDHMSEEELAMDISRRVKRWVPLLPDADFFAQFKIFQEEADRRTKGNA